MKEKLITELNEFKNALSIIDARHSTIWEADNEHKKHFETLRSIDTILTNIRNRIDRFYSKGFQYNKELADLSKYLLAYRVFFGEFYPGCLSMEDCKLRVISILEGIVIELENYDIPSKKDPKFDK